MPPPRKRAAKPLKAVPDLESKAPNGQGKGELSSVKKWQAAGRPLGKNKAQALAQTVYNSGPDMPPGKYLSWLPTPEEVPPKPTTEPEMEYTAGHRDGHPEWQLHTYMLPSPRDLEKAGEPWVSHRVWEVRWVPPDERRCQSRSIGKFSEWQGNRCVALAIKGGKVCNMHGGKLANVKKAAQATLARAALPAAERLVNIALTKRGVSDADRIKAIVQILDRAGVEGRTTVELEIKPWQAVLEGIYAKQTGKPLSDEEVEGVDYELLDEEDEEDFGDGE